MLITQPVAADRVEKGADKMPYGIRKEQNTEKNKPEHARFADTAKVRHPTSTACRVGAKGEAP